MLSMVCSLYLLTGYLMLSVKMIKNNIMLLLLQSLCLSALAFLLSVSTAFDWHTFFIGCLTLVVKGFLLPFILFRLVKNLHGEREIKPYFGPVLSMFAGAVIVGLSYGYIVPVILEDIKTGQDMLATAIAAILFGFFYLVSRRNILNQVIGIIVIENGLFLSALAITGGMPLLIELGIFFDILIGVLVMGAISYKISDRFHSLDNKKLNRLRG